MATGYRTDLDGNRVVRGKRARASWSKAMRAAFLDHLAATCNVKQSAAVAKVEVRTLYRIRRREADFAAKWEEALALGYQMIETRLVGHVLAGRWRDAPLEDADDDGGIDFDSALRLLGQHRAAAAAKPGKGGPRPQFASPEDTNATLLKRLRAIEVRRARDAEWAAAVEAGRAGLLTHDRGAGDRVPASDAVIEQAPQAKAVSDGE